MENNIMVAASGTEWLNQVNFEFEKTTSIHDTVPVVVISD